jgi:hypothetical protein
MADELMIGLDYPAFDIGPVPSPGNNASHSLGYGSAGSKELAGEACSDRHAATASELADYQLAKPEWAPGLLIRALVMGIGSVFGGNMRSTTGGARATAFIIVALVVNETAMALVAPSRRKWLCGVKRSLLANADGTLPRTWDLRNRLYDTFQHVTMLMRYFSVTTLAYAVNEALKTYIYGDSDVTSIMMLFVGVFLLNEVVEAISSTHR